MKPPCPDLLRKGVVARVPEEAGSSVLLLLFVDLRFADGHVERWYGQGSIRVPAAPPDGPALVGWADEVMEEDGATLYGELTMSFRDVSRDALAGLPTEVLVEWNARNTWDGP